MTTPKYKDAFQFENEVCIADVLEYAHFRDYVTVSDNRAFIITREEVVDIYQKDGEPATTYVIELCSGSKSAITSEQDWNDLYNSITRTLTDANERTN